MAEKKNQHYVPQFYLRNFSIENIPKQIGVFNLGSERYIYKASIKHQASKNYLYGIDGAVEKALGNLEQVSSEVIQSIINSEKCPQKGSSEWQILILFVASIESRSPKTRDMLLESYNASKHILDSIDPTYTTRVSYPAITADIAMAFLLTTIIDSMSAMSDLSFKLLINKTPIPFISSDYPLVRYNQLFEIVAPSHTGRGFGQIGLQILFPISPNLSIFFYDSEVYKVGNKKEEHLNINNQLDIEYLNILQITNCYSNLYFNEKIEEQYIRNLFAKSRDYTTANQCNYKTQYMHGIDKVSDNPNKKPNIVVLQYTENRIGLSINGIKVKRKKIKQYKKNIYNADNLIRPACRELLKQKNEVLHKGQTSDLLKLQLPNTQTFISKYEIYDLLGNSIVSDHVLVTNGLIEIPISTYSHGAYFIRISDKQKTYHTKFIKK